MKLEITGSNVRHASPRVLTAVVVSNVTHFKFCGIFFAPTVCYLFVIELSFSTLGKLEYQAQSPDENALVSAARNFV